MPFGTLNAQSRLGVSHVSRPDAIGFVQYVLRLPSNVPIYQQQLVRDGTAGIGPARSAEWCNNPAPGIAKTQIVREISAHNFGFGRCNLNDSPIYRFNEYVTEHTNQLFYVCNEPEMFTSLSSQGTSGRCTCFEAPTWDIDSYLAGCFPNALNSFWETSEVGMDINCATSAYRRIRAEAMARVYLRLRQRAAEVSGAGHIVLPPSSINAELGAQLDNESWRADSKTYWTTFYDGVASGFSGGGACNPAGIVPAQLEALHTHRYTPYNRNQPETDPLRAVAGDAIAMRRGADWYRDRYNGGNALPLDYYVSEMGPDWRIAAGNGHDPSHAGIAWSGGFSDFQKGLSYWNSLLCWLTRRAPLELNLQGAASGQHTVYTGIHQPDIAPYARAGLTSTNQRNQWYFNLDAWNTYVHYNAPMFVTSLADASLKYQRSFSMLKTTTWDNRSWTLAPFGVCYSVWSQVGADANTTQFGTGFFYDNGQAASIGRVNLPVPVGWSTIYVPFIKNVGSFSGSVGNGGYIARWHRGDGSYRDHGSIGFDDFPDTAIYSGFGGYSQLVYSAMMLPLIVQSSIARTIELELYRTTAGPAVIVGRPVVMRGVGCSWSIFH